MLPLAAQLERVADWHLGELLARRVPMLLYHVFGLVEQCRPALWRDAKALEGVLAVWRCFLAVCRTLARQPATDEFKPVLARAGAFALQLAVRFPDRVPQLVLDDDVSSDGGTAPVFVYGTRARARAPARHQERSHAHGRTQRGG